ncbi:Ribonuclease R [Actinomyces bovis]|uniref:Ribonuclease R n=1 Tax=Actinomyces bovis TaxID=1658 RepID=A0ABY1VP50_9ACTO|nr:RNB domain-containing ribonuclease [Actinomyces bovis]SPT53527.1 Ribonuclease R [Actinomyces bovis]VEG55475.1 Ribonuclease R [Actinomyces israelii]
MTRSRISRFTAPPAEVSAALDSLRQRFEIPSAFSAAAQVEAEQAARDWQADGVVRFLQSGARDARDLQLVTIDPPGSKDLDQALLIESPGTSGFSGAPGTPGEPGSAASASAPAASTVPGHTGARPLPTGTVYRVSYAIASLGTFVQPGGALDTELHSRGETIYIPDRPTALHPEALSHAVASLLPDQDTPACLWTIDLDAAGTVLAAHVERALVRSRARLHYQQVQDAIDGLAPLPPEAPTDLPTLLAAVGRLRQAQEVSRGGISLRTPEQEVQELPGHSPEGAPTGYRLVFRATLPAEEYNAQISLLTGICAAQIMLKAGVGVLRTMPPAPEESLKRLRRVARGLKVDWPAAQPYPELIRSLDSAQPAHAAFMDQAAGLFRGAGYKAFGVAELPVPEGDGATHAALGCPYAHVTAPLRRLVDRYGEEVCLAVCAGQPVPPWVLDALPALPETMASCGRRASSVERGALDTLEALVLRGSVGEIFDAVITSVRGPRGEVVLAEPAVVSTVVAAEKQRLPVGDAVKVRLEQADPAQGVSRFGLVSS